MVVERVPEPRREPIRGRITDAPWGTTLAAILSRSRTGQLTIRSSAGTYVIAFSRGMVVGASSPVPADSLARIAQTEKLVTPKRVAELARGRRPVTRDELEQFITALELVPEQARRLKRRILLQRAARTFGVEAGDYEVTDRVTIPVVLGTDVDVCAVIYQGARLNLHSDRLVTDLAKLGTRFALATDAAGIARFELGEAEQPIIEALRFGTSVAELEATCRDLDPRMIQAVLYALVVCNAAERADTGAMVRPPGRADTIADSRTDTLHDTIHDATPQLLQDSISGRIPRGTETPVVPRDATLSCVPMIIRADPEITNSTNSTRASSPSSPSSPLEHPVRSRGTKVRAPTERAMTDPFLEARPTLLRPGLLDATAVARLLAQRNELLERGADYFTLLGLPVGAPIEAVQSAYLDLARNIKPERLTELGLRDPGFVARSLYAQASIAHTVLTDPARREQYMTELRRDTPRAPEAGRARPRPVRQPRGDK